MNNKIKKYDVMTGDIGEIAREAKEEHMSGDQLWESFPVDPMTFLTGKEFLGKKIVADCPPDDVEVYAGVVEDFVNICTLKQDGTFPYNHVVLIEAPGSGKSTLVSFILCYVLYILHNLRSPQKFLHCDPRHPIQMINASQSEAQSKRVVYEYVRSAVREMSWFRERNYMPNDYKESQLEFPKKIVVTPTSSAGSSVLGSNLLCTVIDEVAAFIKTRDHDGAEDLYKTFLDRMMGRFVSGGYLMVLISAPGYEGDFMERTFERLKDNPRAYCRRRAHWESRPHNYGKEFFSVEVRTPAGKVTEALNVPMELKGKVETEYWDFLRTWAARPSAAISQFFKEEDSVLRCFLKEVQDPLRDLLFESNYSRTFTPLDAISALPPWVRGAMKVQYVLSLDMAKGGEGNCKFAVAMAHRGENKNVQYEENGVSLLRSESVIRLDMMARFGVGDQEEVDVNDVISFIEFLKHDRGFDIVDIVLDEWMSLMVRQTFNKMGYRVEIVHIDNNPQIYTTLKDIMKAGRFYSFYRESLIEELRCLEEVNGRICKKPDKFKDQADTLALAVYKAIGGSGKRSYDRPRQLAMGMLAQGMATPKSGGFGLAMGTAARPGIDKLPFGLA